jgi:hypothetical protein
MDDYLTHLERIGGCFDEEDIEEQTCDECGDTLDRCKCPKPEAQ